MITWNYNETKKLTDEQILKKIVAMYPEKDIYKISVGWRENRKYILKAKGLQGDLIGLWE